MCPRGVVPEGHAVKTVYRPGQRRQEVLARPVGHSAQTGVPGGAYVPARTSGRI